MGKISILGICLLSIATFAQAQPDVDRQELQGIDDQVQALKKDVIQINHELSLLEEKLIFPSTTQFAVFVSLGDSDFRLDSLNLSVNTKEVMSHIYTYRELEALQKGGVQKLYTGNIPTGTHMLTAILKGKTDGGKDIEKTAEYRMHKEVGPKFIELQVMGDGGKSELRFQDW